MSTEAHELFVRNWATYQKIIDADYMHHRLFSASINDRLRSLQGDIRVLDTGCGDAAVLTGFLSQLQTVQYTGYDLSEPALAIAAENLSNATFPFSLKQGPMEELIKSEEQDYTVIHVSYALHHLQDIAKRQFLTDCRKRLVPGGVLFLTDVFRTSDISRDEYLDDYINVMNNDWGLLTKEEKESIEAHVRAFDFPAKLTDMAVWLDDAGFRKDIFLSGDAHHCQFVC